jgi:anthranilate synthase component 1
VRRGPSYAVEREFAKADYLAAVSAQQGIHRCRRHDAGADRPAAEEALHRKPAVAVPRAALAQPQPLHVLLRHGHFQIVGASPEILVRREHTPEGDKVTIRPLAGTRPRGATPEQDKALEQELGADPKERAEHLMLIDLARNDIGRIAKTGSVKVTEAFAIERYSHVMHIVSNVEGMLDPA